MPDGVDHVHAIVDDHTRLAYAEIHSDARAQTAAAFLVRALAFYASHGISARRLMTDNAWAYTRSRVFRKLLAKRERPVILELGHPRVNGSPAERQPSGLVALPDDESVEVRGALRLSVVLEDASHLCGRAASGR